MENQLVTRKKNVFYESVYPLFILTAFVALCVAVVFKEIFPASFFDVSITDFTFSISSSRIWFMFAAYLLVLATIYFIISKTNLKTKKWLVVSHYTFILLFLVFFAIFSSLSNAGVQKLLSGIPVLSIITAYGVVFLIDIIFFILGIFLLLINLFSLSKKRSK